MAFHEIFLLAFPVIMILMTALWIVSVIIKNASIVDPFWGLGFITAAVFYFVMTGHTDERGILVLILVLVWGIRLSIYLFRRNAGKGEDYRYREFRKKFGEQRYWWFSFFQVFLLQGFLLWLISAPLLGAMFDAGRHSLHWPDIIAFLVWIFGFVFEAGGDYQMAKFKANPANKAKVLDSGFWRYTRHPNYFGDSMVWWGFGLFSAASSCYLPLLSSLLMMFLLIKVSGVAMLEKSLKVNKPEYNDYIRKTNAFFPWFPGRK